MDARAPAVTLAEPVELAHAPDFRLGAMQVRPAVREVVLPNGEPRLLEPRVMQVLVALARAEGAVLTRDDLAGCCWEGRIVSEDALNRVISKLHRLSEQDQGRSFTLQTIRGVGYRMTAAPVAAEPAHAPPPRTAPDPAAAAAALSVSAKEEPRLRRPRRAAVAALMFAAALLGAGAWWTARGRAPAVSAPAAAGAPVTLAVLPFDDLSGAQQDAFLADSLSRELRNRLSRMRGLRVIAEASSFALADRGLTATEMGRRLGSDLLLDGSVRRAGETLRVTTELVDARTGVQVWQQTSTHPAADVSALSDVVSGVLIQELVARLGPDHVQVLAPGRPRDPQAFRLTLQARRLLDRRLGLIQQGRRPEADVLGAQALQLVEQALAADPEEPAALMLLGQLRSAASMRVDGAPPTPAEVRARMAVYAGRALAADPNEPSALSALAEHNRRDLWRWSEAERLFRRALAVDPNYADAHAWYAYLLSTVGRCEEGLAHARAAADIDPVLLRYSVAEARLLTCLGRHEEAAGLYRKAFQADPANVFLMREVALKHLMNRDPAALRAFEAFMRGLWSGRTPPEGAEAALRRARLAADALEGRPDAFLRLVEADAAEPERLSRFGRRDGDIRWTLAVEFAHAGRPAQAVEQLEAALNAGSLYIPDTLPYGAHEFTAAVRADPRYQALWRSDPRLNELVRLRLQALKQGRMAGRLPDGTVVAAARTAAEPL